MASIRSQIADAFKVRVATVTALKSITFDTVRLLANDFQDWELPAAQMIDLGETNVHEIRRGKKMWNLIVEVVIGPSPTTAPTQKDLWDIMEDIEKAVMSAPNLGIAGVIHVHLLGSATDLHLMPPNYTGRLEFAVEYYQELVGPC